jgi:RND family efflux transporter MFP subunit
MKVTPIPGSSMDITRVRPRKRRRGVVLGAAGVVAAIAVTVGLTRLRAAAPEVERAAVYIDRVQRGPMLCAVEGQGTLVPEDIRWVSATAAGRVERILVRPGTAVQPDTVLLELGNPDLELQALEADRQVAGAAASLANLRANLQRDRLGQESVVAGTGSELGEARRRAAADADLARRGFLSALEMAQSRDKAAALADKLAFEQKRLGAQAEGIRAQLAAQTAEIERLRALAAFRHKEVDALHVRAGIAGVLQELPLQVGQSVQAGALLAKVADPRRLKAEVRIPETLAKDVRLGLPAVIDTRNGTVPGKVSRIDPAVQSGTVRVDVAFTAPLPSGARPDLSVEGTIELERLADVVFVARPAAALPGQKTTLFKLDPAGDGASRVPVELGKASIKTIEVVRGLVPGDRVIVSDMEQWDHVDRVRLR